MQCGSYNGFNEHGDYDRQLQGDTTKRYVELVPFQTHFEWCEYCQHSLQEWLDSSMDLDTVPICAACKMRANHRLAQIQQDLTQQKQNNTKTNSRALRTSWIATFALIPLYCGMKNCFLICIVYFVMLQLCNTYGSVQFPPLLFSVLHIIFAMCTTIYVVSALYLKPLGLLFPMLLLSLYIGSQYAQALGFKAACHGLAFVLTLVKLLKLEKHEQTQRTTVRAQRVVSTASSSPIITRATPTTSLHQASPLPKQLSASKSPNSMAPPQQKQQPTILSRATSPTKFLNPLQAVQPSQQFQYHQDRNPPADGRERDLVTPPVFTFNYNQNSNSTTTSDNIDAEDDDEVANTFASTISSVQLKENDEMEQDEEEEQQHEEVEMQDRRQRHALLTQRLVKSKQITPGSRSVWQFVGQFLVFCVASFVLVHYAIYPLLSLNKKATTH